MKWKPLSTLVGNTAKAKPIMVARLHNGALHQVSLCILQGNLNLDGGWTHWCEQPEIPHPAESWPVDAKSPRSFMDVLRCKGDTLEFAAWVCEEFYSDDGTAQKCAAAIRGMKRCI